MKILRITSFALVMMACLLGACSSPSTNLATSDVQDERFLIHKNGEMVLDSTTGLVWMRCSLGQKWDGRTCSGTAGYFLFDDAIKASSSFNTKGGRSGFSDWEMPTLKQLKSLRSCSNGFSDADVKTAAWYGIDRDRFTCKNGSQKPAIDISTMPRTPAEFFLSASIRADGSPYGVDFGTGQVSYSDRRGRFVRLVQVAPVTGDPAALGFSREQIATSDNAIRQSSIDWSYDDLKGATQRFINLGNKYGSVYSIYKSGSISSFAIQKACSLDTQNVRKFLLSGASEIWYRHGRSDVDEMHSISEENMFWVGDCLNGKASGEGIIVYFYRGKINSSDKIGAVRTVVTVNNGNPTGTIFAYSNARTCFNTCQDNSYAKEIGKLSEGSAGVDLAQQDVVKVSNQNNQAMGAILGSVMVKAAEVLKEGASSSSSSGSSGSASSNVTWTITSSENGGGLAHWYTKKYWGKCTSGRKAGETITIHLLNSGLYQEVYGSGKKSLSESALDACS